MRLVGIAMLGAILWFLIAAGPGRRFEPPGPRARLALALVQAAIFAAAAWWNRQRARTSRRAGWHKGWAIFMVALAGLHPLKGALELVE